MKPLSFPIHPSRRTLLRMLAASGAGLLLPRGLAAAPAPALAPALAPGSLLFEEVPPEKSGITWVHENAMSPERYLPETMGPGCAFLDYDNDGWMDIYLVNSGPADFYTPKPPLRNALYKNNRDGTFTDVTEKAGRRRRHLRDGRGGRRLRQRRLSRHVRHRLRPARSCTTTTATALSPTSPRRRPASTSPGWTTSAVWFDYDNDGKLDLFVCSFVESRPRQGRLLRRQQAGAPLLLHSARVQADAEPALSQQRRRHLHRGLDAAPTSQRALGKASAWWRPTSTTTA